MEPTNFPSNYEELISDDRFVQWVQDPKSDPDYQDRWMGTYPDRLDDFERAQAFVELMQFKPISTSGLQMSSMLEGIHERINQPAATEKELTLKPFLRVAASVSAIVLGVWFLYSIINYGKGYGEREVATRKGQKTSLILSDGSKVWLNGGSRITFHEDFSDKEIREVLLVGEAFFEVTSNPEKPFFVKTKGMTIRVTGTSFNVKAYEEDGQVETALVEGEVEVTSAGKSEPKLLQPNEMAVFTKESEEIRVQSVDASTLASWHAGTLIFEEEPFSLACKRLERWYGVEIEVVEGADCRLSAKIGEESLGEVLALLKLTTRISYTVESNQVKLSIKCK